MFIFIILYFYNITIDNLIDLITYFLLAFWCAVLHQHMTWLLYIPHIYDKCIDVYTVYIYTYICIYKYIQIYVCICTYMYVYMVCWLCWDQILLLSFQTCVSVWAVSCSTVTCLVFSSAVFFFFSPTVFKESVIKEDRDSTDATMRHRCVLSDCQSICHGGYKMRRSERRDRAAALRGSWELSQSRSVNGKWWHVRQGVKTESD